MNDTNETAVTLVTDNATNDTPKRKGKKATPIELPDGEFTLADVQTPLKRISLYLRLQSLVKEGYLEKVGKRPTGGVGHPLTVFRRVAV